MIQTTRVSYENPEVPHEVNVSRERPVIEFIRLAAGLALIVVVLSAILFFFGGWLARFVPFTVERSWVGDTVFGVAIDKRGNEGTDNTQPAAIEAYIRRLTQQLASHADLPEGMTITAHYADMPEPNAFATLGGHIVITRGLYERMPSENALATVIAHEIGHVKARDPISALGGAASFAVLLALFSGDAQGLAPSFAHVVQLGYSRQAETRADETAVAVLLDYYGHAGGSPAVFEVLRDARDPLSRNQPTLLSTHPADEARIARMTEAAAGWDRVRAPLRPLEIKPEEGSVP